MNKYKAKKKKKKLNKNYTHFLKKTNKNYKTK